MMYLLIFSLLFYFYGEPKYIIILLLSCFINYMAGLLIEKYRNKSKLILMFLQETVITTPHINSPKKANKE